MSTVQTLDTLLPLQSMNLTQRYHTRFQPLWSGWTSLFLSQKIGYSLMILTWILVGIDLFLLR